MEFIIDGGPSRGLALPQTHCGPYSGGKAGVCTAAVPFDSSLAMPGPGLESPDSDSPQQSAGHSDTGSVASTDTSEALLIHRCACPLVAGITGSWALARVSRWYTVHRPVPLADLCMLCSLETPVGPSKKRRCYTRWADRAWPMPSDHL